MKIKRYNLGFGWFGPLEECEDGRLMKAEDVITLIAENERLNQNWDFAVRENIKLRKAVTSLLIFISTLGLVHFAIYLNYLRGVL